MFSFLRNSDTAQRHRLQQGERAAFEAVVRQHYESVYRQLWHLCQQDSETAADLTQETFVEAWASLSRFEGRSTLRTWLHTLAVRVWYRRCRQRAARPAETPLADLLAESLAATETSSLPAEAAEQRALLDAALAKLPAPCREAVQLFYREELRYREIAERQGVPIGTVKSRLNTALRRLRVLLTPHQEELF